MAENRTVRRASTLIGFQGRLVPIGGPDCAESPPREVIDLTDDSEDDHEYAKPKNEFYNEHVTPLVTEPMGCSKTIPLCLCEHLYVYHF